MSRRRRGIILLCISLLFLSGCKSFMREETQNQNSDTKSYKYPIIMEPDSTDMKVTVTYGLNRYAKLGSRIHVKVVVENGIDNFDGNIQVQIPTINTQAIYSKKVRIEPSTTQSYYFQAPVVREDMQFHVRILSASGKSLCESAGNVLASNLAEEKYIGVIGDCIDSKEIVTKGMYKIFMLDSKAIYDTYDNLNVLDYILLDEANQQSYTGHEEELKAWLQDGGILLLENSKKQTDIGKEWDYGFGRCIRVRNMDSINKLSDYVEGMNNDAYLFSTGVTDRQIKQSIHADAVTSVPVLHHYIIILGAYIIIIGPIIYLILKKIKRKTWYWGIVPILSVAFIGIIYGVGKNTRINESYLRYLSIKQIAEDGYTQDTTYCSAVNPSTSSLQMKTTDQYEISPLYVTQDYYGITQESDQKGEPTSALTVSVDTTSPQLMKTCTFDGVESLKPQYFVLNTSYDTVTEDNEKAYTHAMQVHYDDYTLSGTVTNNLGIDLENVIILSNYTVAYLGEVSQGETVQLDGALCEYLPSNDLLYTKDYSKRLKAYVQDTDKEDTVIDRLQKDSRYQLLINAMDNWVAYDRSESYLIGFAKNTSVTQYPYGIGINKVDMGTELIVKELAINTEHEKERETYFVPSIDSYMTVNSGSYYKDLRLIESDTLSVTYSFGNQELEQLEYVKEYNTEFYTDSYPADELWTGFYGKMYLYNIRTGEYDNVMTSKQEIVLNDLSDYIGSDNTLKVLYEVASNSANSNFVTLPRLSAILKEGTITK